MQSTPCFTDLPIDVENHIITYTNYKIIQNLRSVCKFLYNLINTNIESLLKEILIYSARSCSMMELIGINRHMAVGNTSSIVLTYKGLVYVKGSSQYGQLGLGNHHSPDEFTLISNLKNIIDVCATDYSSLFLTKEGNVYICGRNMYQMISSDSHLAIISTPTLIPHLSKIISIASSHNFTSSHTLALREDGCVYVFGCPHSIGLKNLECVESSSGYMIVVPQLIKNVNNIVQVATRSNSSFMLNRSGQVYNFGNGITTPILIPDINDVIQITAGNTHVLFLKSDVLLLGDGYFDYFENGVITKVPTLIPNLNNIINVSVGDCHLLALNKVGQVYSLGLNNCGQLGFDCTIKKQLTPALIPDLNDIIEILTTCNSSFAISNNGDIFEFGSRGYTHYMKPTCVGNIWHLSKTPI